MISLVEFVIWLLDIYSLVIIAAALISWVSPDPRNPIVRFLYGVTEPVLAQIRRRLPFVFAGGFDFSPLVLMLAIQFLDMVVVRSLQELAFRMDTGLGALLRVV